VQPEEAPKVVPACGPLLAEVFDRAIPLAAGKRSKQRALRLLRRCLGHIPIAELTAQTIIQHIEAKRCAPPTAQHEFSVLKTTLHLAEIAWEYDVPAVLEKAHRALKLLGLVGSAQKRTRRPTADELERLCAWFDEHSDAPVRDLISFSIHTAMRRGEIMGLLWADYNPQDKTITIRDRKDPKQKLGNHQEVPLLDEAIAIIERQPRVSTRIFPYNPKTLSSTFPRVCRKLKINDLHWHDLRHEGVSRLFERGYQIHEVAMFSGHRDWAMLKRYTQLRAKDLRRLPVRVEGDGETAQHPDTAALVKQPAVQPVVSPPTREPVPGVVVEYFDRRARGHEHGEGLIVGISPQPPLRYTIRVNEGTKYEHTRKIYPTQIVAVH
jgi:integrase